MDYFDILGAIFLTFMILLVVGGTSVLAGIILFKQCKDHCFPITNGHIPLNQQKPVGHTVHTGTADPDRVAINV